MNAYEIETMITEDVSVDIHFDLCGVDRVAGFIAARFAALEAENARLREALTNARAETFDAIIHNGIAMENLLKNINDALEVKS